jgi:hypothetical protein
MRKRYIKPHIEGYEVDESVILIGLSSPEGDDLENSEDALPPEDWNSLSIRRSSNKSLTTNFSSSDETQSNGGIGTGNTSPF